MELSFCSRSIFSWEVNHDVGKLNRCRGISKFRREALHFKKHPRVAKEMCLSSTISVLVYIHLYVYILFVEQNQRYFRMLCTNCMSCICPTHLQSELQVRNI